MRYRYNQVVYGELRPAAGSAGPPAGRPVHGAQLGGPGGIHKRGGVGVDIYYGGNKNKQIIAYHLFLAETRVHARGVSTVWSVHIQTTDAALTVSHPLVSTSYSINVGY